MKTLEHFSNRQEHMSAKTNCLKATVLSLAVSSSLLTGCQLNTQALSNLVVFDEEVTQQEIAAKKQVLYHAYEQIVPVLNSYYPINSTTYGLIKDGKSNTLTALSHEVLANTLTEQGLALCQLRENCPINTVYLENKVFKEPSLHTMLVSLSTPELKLTKLFDEQGMPVSTMAINTSLSPIAPPSSLANRSKAYEATYEPKPLPKTASATPKSQAKAKAKSSVAVPAKVASQAPTVVTASATPLARAKTTATAKLPTTTKVATQTPADTATAAPTAKAKAANTVANTKNNVNAMGKAKGIPVSAMTSTLVAKQQTDAKTIIKPASLKYQADQLNPAMRTKANFTQDEALAANAASQGYSPALTSPNKEPNRKQNLSTSAGANTNVIAMASHGSTSSFGYSQAAGSNLSASNSVVATSFANKEDQKTNSLTRVRTNGVASPLIHAQALAGAGVGNNKVTNAQAVAGYGASASAALGTLASKDAHNQHKTINSPVLSQLGKGSAVANEPGKTTEELEGQRQDQRQGQDKRANQIRRVYKFNIPDQMMQQASRPDTNHTGTSTALSRKPSVFVFDPNMSVAQVNHDVESH